MPIDIISMCYLWNRDKTTTSGVKILNKSAIRILNKEAQMVIEPIIAKPVLKCDDDGNMAAVTQILEQDLPDPEDLPPAKVNKTGEKSQQPTKIVSIQQVPARRKQPTKPAQTVEAASSSTSPKENKKPAQKTPNLPVKMVSGLKQVSIKPITPTTYKTRQPTIQDALRAIPHSVSIKKIESQNKPKPVIVETEKPTQVKSLPRAAAPASAGSSQPSNKATPKQSPNLTRTLRQRTDTTPETKVTPKASPVSVAPIKKSPPQNPIPEVTKSDCEETRRTT